MLTEAIRPTSVPGPLQVALLHFVQPALRAASPYPRKQPDRLTLWQSGRDVLPCHPDELGQLRAAFTDEEHAQAHRAAWERGGKLQVVQRRWVWEWGAGIAGVGRGVGGLRLCPGSALTLPPPRF